MYYSKRSILTVTIGALLAICSGLQMEASAMDNHRQSPLVKSYTRRSTAGWAIRRQPQSDFQRVQALWQSVTGTAKQDPFIQAFITGLGGIATSLKPAFANPLRNHRRHRTVSNGTKPKQTK